MPAEGTGSPGPRGTDRWGSIAVGVAVLALCAPWVNIPQDQADSAGMLAHLHSIFVDGDLLYDNEYARLSMSPLFAFVTGEGVVSNHWPMGATWLQLPGYALGLVAAKVLAALGVGNANALGVVPLLAVRAWACLILGLVCAWLVRDFGAAPSGGLLGAVARGRPVRLPLPANRWVGALVALAFVGGTPLLYYATEAPLRPHLWGAACMFAFMGLWIRDDVMSGSRRRTLVLATLLGLAATVRPQLAPLAVLVVADAWRQPDRARHLVVAALGLALWPMLHLRLQLWMYGPDLASYAGTVTHHLRHFAVSPHHGALSWCPVLAVGLVAVGRSAWRRERGAVLIAVLLAHQVWLDAGMRPITPESVLGTRTWAGGTGFAARKLVDVLPLLMPAVASLVVAARGTRWGGVLGWSVAALCLPTLALHGAAFVESEATTGAVIVSYGALAERMAAPLSAARWTAAFAERSVPVSVPLIVGVVVLLPLAAAVLRTKAGVRPAKPRTRWALAAAALVGGALAAHGWLSVCQVRSDAALVAAPARMRRAGAFMGPRHAQTVAQIPLHHAALRQMLGPDAAPH